MVVEGIVNGNAIPAGWAAKAFGHGTRHRKNSRVNLFAKLRAKLGQPPT